MPKKLKTNWTNCGPYEYEAMMGFVKSVEALQQAKQRIYSHAAIYRRDGMKEMDYNFATHATFIGRIDDLLSSLYGSWREWGQTSSTPLKRKAEKSTIHRTSKPTMRKSKRS